MGTAAGSLNTFVVQSLSNDICIAQGKPAIKNQEYPNAGPAVTALRAGQLDAYNDTALANAGIAASSNGVFELVTLDPAELEKYDSALLGIATLKSNPDMAAAISGALQKLEADGTYMKILDEYGAGNSGLTNAELAVNALTGTPAGQRIE